MALVRRRNGIYYAEFHDANRTPPTGRWSLKLKRKDEARRTLMRLEQAWRRGDYDP